MTREKIQALPYNNVTWMVSVQVESGAVLHNERPNFGSKFFNRGNTVAYLDDLPIYPGEVLDLTGEMLLDLTQHKIIFERVPSQSVTPIQKVYVYTKVLNL